MKVEPNNGKNLEKAVRLIQEVLLANNDPGLKGGKVTIEPNKIVTVDNTRHEVDLYVVTNPGTTYASIVLFECKDWKEPVSKNEVMSLKEKVDLLNATRGILVAAQLTGDAEETLDGDELSQEEKARRMRELFGVAPLEQTAQKSDPLKPDQTESNQKTVEG